MRLACLIAALALLVACDGGEPHTSNMPPVAFTHGVASGDVTDDSAMLWTRAEGASSLTVEVSTDGGFGDETAEVGAETSVDRDFTVKARVEGLEPATRYHYRFRAGNATSEHGTFVTAPEAGSATSLRFIFSGDSDGRRNQDGTPVWNEFEVLATAAADDPDFFLYFGDTVYADRDPAATDLAGFRAKYKENRGYAALRQILAATSAYTTWDDHEVHDNFAGTTVDPALFEAARQAFREYMPIDDEGDPTRLYRTFRWGRDVEMILLDARSYRDAAADDACRAAGAAQADPIPASAFEDAPPALRAIRGLVGLPAELPEGCADAIADPARTMLGADQRQFLFDWLATSDATWKIVVSQVPVQALLFSPYDRWEGYAAERSELLTFIRDGGIDNVVFLTTDFHSNVFGPVRMDPFADTEPIAYEVVAGPIATAPLRQDIVSVVGAAAGAVDAFLEGVVRVDCVEMDSYAYALVEADAEAMTITAKDETGRQLCRTRLEATR